LLLCAVLLLQFAKSAASWLLQALLLAYGNITAALPACFIIFMAALVVWLYATLHLSKHMHTFAAADAASVQGLKVAETVPAGAAAGQAVVAMQQQQAELEGWWLPLPRELAAAAAAAERWPAAGTAAALGPAAAAAGAASGAAYSLSASSMLASSDAGGGITDGSVSVDGGSIDVGGVALPTLPHLLHDAAYWDRVFAALADDALLLESVVVSHGLEHAAEAQQQQQQQQQYVVLQQEPGALPQLHDVAGEKQALHTVFDT
jgi:hypothetical protein